MYAQFALVVVVIEWDVPGNAEDHPVETPGREHQYNCETSPVDVVSYSSRIVFVLCITILGLIVQLPYVMAHLQNEEHVGEKHNQQQY